MNHFVTLYNEYIAYIASLALIVIFVFIQINFYRRISNFSLKLLLSYIKIWFPFLVSIFVIFLLFHFSKPVSSFLEEIIEKNFKNPRNAISTINTKWDFIVCSFANTILIGLSTLVYSYDVHKISGQFDVQANNVLSFANNLINLTSYLNLFQLVGLFLLVFFGDNTGGNLLLIFNDVFSLANMILYLVIDDRIIVASQKYHNDEKLKIIALAFSKPARFAKYNVDFACVVGILFTLVFQNLFLKYNDTNYAFAFTTGCITTQLFLTQFIFAAYQSFRLSKT